MKLDSNLCWAATFQYIFIYLSIVWIYDNTISTACGIKTRGIKNKTGNTQAFKQETHKLLFINGSFFFLLIMIINIKHINYGLTYRPTPVLITLQFTPRG